MIIAIARHRYNWFYTFSVSALEPIDSFRYYIFTSFATLWLLPRCVRSTLDSGTTTAVYFATIHTESSLVLADTCTNLGQRAYVGKVCMDRNSPDTYR